MFKNMLFITCILIKYCASAVYASNILNDNARSNKSISIISNINKFFTNSNITSKKYVDGLVDNLKNKINGIDSNVNYINKNFINASFLEQYIAENNISNSSTVYEIFNNMSSNLLNITKNYIHIVVQDNIYSIDNATGSTLHGCINDNGDCANFTVNNFYNNTNTVSINNKNYTLMQYSNGTIWACDNDGVCSPVIIYEAFFNESNYLLKSAFDNYSNSVDNTLKNVVLLENVNGTLSINNKVATTDAVSDMVHNYYSNSNALVY